MERISLPKWIVPLVLALGFLGTLIFPVSILADAGKPKLSQEMASFLSVAIVLLALFGALSCFWLAGLLREEDVRGLPLLRTQEGRFAVLFARIRAREQEQVWDFLVAPEQGGTLFLSYPREMVVEETTAEEGILEIRRIGDSIMVVYFKPSPAQAQE